MKSPSTTIKSLFLHGNRPTGTPFGIQGAASAAPPPRASGARPRPPGRPAPRCQADAMGSMGILGWQYPLDIPIGSMYGIYYMLTFGVY